MRSLIMWHTNTILYTGLNLRNAAAQGNLEKVKAGLKYNVDINEAGPRSGQTALHRAVQYCTSNHYEIIKFLLKNGADPTIKDKEGNTAMNYFMRTHRSSSSLTRRYFQVHALISQYYILLSIPEQSWRLIIGREIFPAFDNKGSFAVFNNPEDAKEFVASDGTAEIAATNVVFLKISI